MRKELRRDLTQQITADFLYLIYLAFMDDQPATVTERMTIRFLHSRLRGGPHVGEKRGRRDVRGQFVQIEVVPGGSNAAIQAGLCALAVPADAESIAVGRRLFGEGTQALVDERVFCAKEDVFQSDRRASIRQPAAHGFGSRGATPRGEAPAEPASRVQENSSAGPSLLP